eukprot:CAMPEP_0178638860 /NCGR_PEP_ID=MMETSP0698-20121128/15139_1 /TAXON_ID=265572 /ORGANISM="Extubocellulus spinifer, Strain CCMP396" /LENGTH=120 /DNA_ID=CAMNT_0020279123 /DNA_START=395 /DNA_END=755 /DNA_ORIENTATION=+
MTGDEDSNTGDSSPRSGGTRSGKPYKPGSSRTPCAELMGRQEVDADPLDVGPLDEDINAVVDAEGVATVTPRVVAMTQVHRGPATDSAVGTGTQKPSPTVTTSPKMKVPAKTPSISRSPI